MCNTRIHSSKSSQLMNLVGENPGNDIHAEGHVTCQTPPTDKHSIVEYCCGALG